MSLLSLKPCLAPGRVLGLSNLVLLVSLSLGCGSKTLDIAVEQVGCEGISEGEVPDSTLVQTKQGNDLVIYRDWVFKSSTAEFEPEFEQSRKEVEIYEYWTDDGGDEAVETCFRPTIVIENPDAGKFTLFWFIGDEDTPFDNVLIEVD